MSKKISDPLKLAEEYYTSKIRKYGPSPQGVDWNSTEGQNLRFAQLCKLFPLNTDFTVLDYGCGYGGLYDYLRQQQAFHQYEYIGYDISLAMIEEARNIHSHGKWITELGTEQADYVVASGIFNVKFDMSDEPWKRYILDTIEKFNAISRKGFAFNVLSTYSDKDKRAANLFFADPLELFDLCKSKYSRYVSLIHDYKLYEFTILVRKCL